MELREKLRLRKVAILVLSGAEEGPVCRFVKKNDIGGRPLQKAENIRRVIRCCLFCKVRCMLGSLILARDWE